MTRPDRAAFLAANPFPHRHTLGLFYRDKMAAIHALLPATAPRRVLEIGGGRSGLSRLCFPAAEVTSIDVDLAELRGTPAGTRAVAADATRLPFADAAFDAVTMFDVVEHVPDDRGAAAEAARVLRPGGCLLVSTPTPTFRYPQLPLLAPLLPDEQTILDSWGHVRRGYHLADLEGLWPGLRLDDARHFQNRLSALTHDIAFATWPPLLRRAVIVPLLPLTWLGFALQRRDRGIMVAARFVKEPVA